MSRRIVAAAAVMAIVVTSCSQPESMSIDAYADAVTESTAAYVDESQEVSLRYQRSVEGQVQQLVAAGADDDMESAMTIVKAETANYLALLDDAMGRYLLALTDLDAPPEVLEQHEAYLRIITSVRSTLPESRDALAKTSTFEEVLDSLVGSGLADGQQAWTALCLSLESAIRDAGRGADLKCVRVD